MTLSLAVLALIGWVVMIILAVVPKNLTINDMVFLYFVIGILTVTVFTLLDINLEWVPVTRDVEKSLALYICRIIIIPLLILMSSMVLLSRLKWIWKGVLWVVILLALSLSDWVYLHFELIRYANWSEIKSALMYFIFMVVIGGIARWFSGLDRGGFQKS